MKKNTDLVKKTRELLGPDGDIMLDCWMALTEDYSIEFAEMVEPYRVYWMEECLPPDEYGGFRRIHERIKSTRMATGEHEYTRYGLQAVAGIQCGGHLAAGYNLVRRAERTASYWRAGRAVQHSGYSPRGMAIRRSQFILATTNCPWCEMFMPPPGGPPEVYQRFEEDNNITRGPEGIYMRPPDRPGFGWDVVVD